MPLPPTSQRADIARIEELRAEGVELVAGSVTDLAGVTRAKYVPLRRLGDFQRSGMGVSPSWSVFCVDSGIAFTPNIGVDGDLRIRIDPADVRLIDDGVAWAPGNLDRPAGPARRRCARARFWRAPNRAPTERGLTALLGAELECTMLAADGGPRVRRIRGRPTASAPRWTVRRSSSTSPGAAERAGLSHRTDPHRVRPRPDSRCRSPRPPPSPRPTPCILARIVIGRAAARHGLRISFSPVPFDG